MNMIAKGLNAIKSSENISQLRTALRYSVLVLDANRASPFVGQYQELFRRVTRKQFLKISGDCVELTLNQEGVWTDDQENVDGSY